MHTTIPHHILDVGSSQLIYKPLLVHMAISCTLFVKWLEIIQRVSFPNLVLISLAQNPWKYRLTFKLGYRRVVADQGFDARSSPFGMWDTYKLTHQSPYSYRTTKTSILDSYTSFHHLCEQNTLNYEPILGPSTKLHHYSRGYTHSSLNHRLSPS